MEGMPIVRLQLDGFRETIVQAMAMHSQEIDDAVENSVRKYLSTDHFLLALDKTVKDIFDKTLTDIVSSYKIKSAIEDLVVQSLKRTQEKPHE